MSGAGNIDIRTDAVFMAVCLMSAAVKIFSRRTALCSRCTGIGADAVFMAVCLMSAAVEILSRRTALCSRCTGIGADAVFMAVCLMSIAVEILRCRIILRGCLIGVRTDTVFMAVCFVSVAVVVDRAGAAMMSAAMVPAVGGHSQSRSQAQGAGSRKENKHTGKYGCQQVPHPFFHDSSSPFFFPQAFDECRGAFDDSFGYVDTYIIAGL